LSAFGGRFVATRGHPGTRPSGLHGPGTLTISSAGIGFAGHRPRWGLIHGASLAVALPVTGAALIAAMDSMDRWIRSAHGDMRLFVVIGGVVLVAVFVAVRALLLRVVQPVAFETTVGFSYVLSLRPTEPERIEVVTTALQLQGVTVFESRERSRLFDEVSAAKNGPQAGYRAPARG
jgi:hypothetical protein